MWYLSLLLIFYAVYPLLERLYRMIGSLTVTAGGILCLFALHHTVVYGHALWLTTAGFLVGVFLSSGQMRLPAGCRGRYGGGDCHRYGCFSCNF